MHVGFLQQADRSLEAGARSSCKSRPPGHSGPRSPSQPGFLQKVVWKDVLSNEHITLLLLQVTCTVMSSICSLVFMVLKSSTFLYPNCPSAQPAMIHAISFERKP